MGHILRDIYSDVSILSFIGLKGGTCAYFFYGLPRFSVDLDFDLLSIDKSKKILVFKKVSKILNIYGKIKNSYIKQNTVFFLLSYGDADHNIKIEINTRILVPDIKEHYEIKEHLGISMFVGKKDYLFASKLAALTLRSTTAMRDIYDVWYFAKNNWDINEEVIKLRTKKTIPEHLDDCISAIEEVKENEILQGLGELVEEKEKAWIRKNLRKEAIFLLKNYRMALK